MQQSIKSYAHIMTQLLGQKLKTLVPWAWHSSFADHYEENPYKWARWHFYWEKKHKMLRKDITGKDQ